MIVKFKIYFEIWENGKFEKKIGKFWKNLEKI